MTLAQHIQRTNPWLGDFNRLVANAFRRFDSQNDDLRVYDHDGSWQLELDLPGVSRDEVEIVSREGQLQLTVKGSATYRLPLTKQIDVQSIVAKLENGVLRISLPKAAASESTKTIEIH